MSEVYHVEHAHMCVHSTLPPVRPLAHQTRCFTDCIFLSHWDFMVFIFLHRRDHIWAVGAQRTSGPAWKKWWRRFCRRSWQDACPFVDRTTRKHWETLSSLKRWLVCLLFWQAGLQECDAFKICSLAPSLLLERHIACHKSFVETGESKGDAIPR